MKPSTTFIAAAIAASIALPAHADAIDDAVRKQSQELAYSETVKAPLGQLVSAASGLEITTGSDGGAITFRRGGTRSTGDAFDSYSFSVTAPLNEGGDESTPLTFDTLASGASIEARFSRLWFPPIQDTDQTAPQFCRDLEARLGRDQAQSMAAEASRRNILCDTGLVAQFGSDEDVHAFNALRFGRNPLVRLAGVSARVGADTFRYVEAGSLTELSVDKTGWSVSAYYAFFRPAKPWLTTFSLEHQDFFEARKSGTICATGGAPCLTGPLGAPSAITKDIVSVDFRYSGPDFSASATLRYDSRQDVFAIEAPIYLQRGSDGAFNGGVRLNWRSDTNESTASIFVGKAFAFGLPD